MTAVARYPDSTKASLEQRLRSRARDRWPQIASLHIRHRGNFSYVDAALADGTMLKLCRLRYVGSASQWQFAIYRASHDDYDESVFPTGLPVGTCQDALDTACGLYLNDPTAWIQPPTNLRARQLSFADSRPCPVLAETGHDVTAITRHAGCCRGAGNARLRCRADPATLSTARAGCQPVCYLVHTLSYPDFPRRMPTPPKRSART